MSSIGVIDYTPLKKYLIHGHPQQRRETIQTKREIIKNLNNIQDFIYKFPLQIVFIVNRYQIMFWERSQWIIHPMKKGYGLEFLVVQEISIDS
ncbi:unnamed protein product [Paramecium octaurelia]|uniref:Uncharacterized protein n=1 Tax=Paramecium octaurelia TaxID=43137 RepID=A0A8S1W7R4_PAROT|nr:unnamed protein product [Paramecium octaurelia]